MKTFILLAVLFGAFSNMHAQSRAWSDGKLRWDEFVLKPDAEKGTSEFRYLIGYETRQRKIGDTLLVRTEAYLNMSVSTSWVHPEGRKPDQLRMHQISFDIAEKHRRQLQIQLDKARKFDGLLEKMQELCETEIRAFQQASRGGMNPVVLSAYEEQLRKELDALPIRAINNPVINKDVHGLGMNFGFGPAVNPGLGAGFGVQYAIEYRYKKHVFGMFGALSGGKLREDVMHNAENLNGTPAHSAVAALKYGHLIPLKNGITLLPFILAGAHEYSERRDESGAWSRNKAAIAAGIDVTKPFYKVSRFQRDPFFGKQSFEAYDMRAQVLTGYINHGNGLAGPYVMISVGAGLTVDFLK
jgi:hypothetical protein